MKRFRFPLRPVATLRAHQELRAREAFGAAMQACVQAERQLVAKRTRVQQFEATLAAGRAGAFSAAAEVHALAAYRSECDAEAAAEKAFAGARATMEQRRNEYFDAHRRLEIVRRLEEKARAAHRVETMRAEQSEFDDFAGRAASRRGARL